MCKVNVQPCKYCDEDEDLYTKVRDGLTIMLYPKKCLFRSDTYTMEVKH